MTAALIARAQDFANTVATTCPWESWVMTCTEANALAGLLTAAGYEPASERLMAAHALTDDEPEDEHYISADHVTRSTT